ncbi:MAG: ANTAR domain-containing protein [Anaerovoracaceae bacterium]|nr:ANTAR domain-containing protein [Anaerovoracaceae bacterium]
MSLKERAYSMLIVSSSDAFNTALTSLLPEFPCDTIHYASDISAAKRAAAGRAYDFIIINSPVHDDQGLRFAINACASGNTVVLLMAKGDIHDEIYDIVAPHGIFTLAKPVSRAVMERALSWMVSSRERLRQFEKKTTSIEQKMEEIRLVNRAKWILISHENLSEPDAHRFIEKTSMNRCISRRQLAYEIIDKYSG